MPPEPKKPIEDLLRAAAKTRRATFGADPAMPNPMRARLHDEVARSGREELREAERPRGPWIWWPRIAAATAVALLLVGGSIVGLRNGKHSGDEKRELAASAPAATNSAGSSNVAGVELAEAVPEPAAKIETATSRPLEQNAAAPSAGGSFAEADNAGARSDRETKAAEGSSAALKKFAEVTIAPAAAAPGWKNLNDEQDVMKGAVASAPPPAAMAGHRSMETANFRQQFLQNSPNRVARFNSKLKQAVNVLRTFQMEQNGTQIQVVDADGSTYTGKIEPLEQKDSRNPSGERQSYAAGSERGAARQNKEGEAAGNEFYFRAAGYNGSLKKQLVFEGKYVVMPPSAKTRARAGAAQNREQIPARVVGTARISGEPPVLVDALSVNP